jgi:hypothetical protein
MTSFTYTWPATLGRPLPDANPQPLLDVSLRRRTGTVPGAYGVELVAAVIAPESCAARHAAESRIRVAAASSMIVLNTACHLETEPGTDGNHESTVHARPLDATDFANAATAAGSWSAHTQPERERLALAIRSYAWATEQSKPIDILLGSRLVFETIVTCGKLSIAKNRVIEKYAIPEVRRILPGADRFGIEHLLREIFDEEAGKAIRRGKDKLGDAGRASAALALARIVLQDSLNMPADADGTARRFTADAKQAHDSGCTLRCGR